MDYARVPLPGPAKAQGYIYGPVTTLTQGVVRHCLLCYISLGPCHHCLPLRHGLELFCELGPGRRLRRVPPGPPRCETLSKCRFSFDLVIGS